MNEQLVKQAIELLQQALNQNPSSTTTARFGEPTEYFGRPFPEAQKEINEWKRSDKEYMAKGAVDVDVNIDYHVFFETEEQFNALSPEMQKLIDKNIDKYYMISDKRCQLWPMVDFDGSYIPKHYIWCFGDYTLFNSDEREEVIDRMMDVPGSIEYWVDSESQKYKPRHGD